MDLSEWTTQRVPFEAARLNHNGLVKPSEPPCPPHLLAGIPLALSANHAGSPPPTHCIAWQGTTPPLHYLPGITWTALPTDKPLR